MGAMDHPPVTTEQLHELMAMTEEEHRAWTIARHGEVTKTYACQDRITQKGRTRWYLVNAHADGCRAMVEKSAESKVGHMKNIQHPPVTTEQLHELMAMTEDEYRAWAIARHGEIVQSKILRVGNMPGAKAQKWPELVNLHADDCLVADSLHVKL